MIVPSAFRSARESKFDVLPMSCATIVMSCMSTVPSWFRSPGLFIVGVPVAGWSVVALSIMLLSAVAETVAVAVVVVVVSWFVAVLMVAVFPRLTSVCLVYPVQVVVPGLPWLWAAIV